MVTYLLNPYRFEVLMANLAVQDVSGGGDVTFTAAAGGGDSVSTVGGGSAAGWTLGTLLLVNNGDVAATTVSVAGRDDVIVGAGAIAIIPVPYSGFGNPRAVTYSSVTSLTVAAVDVS